jgi:hypothetical protein
MPPQTEPEDSLAPAAATDAFRPSGRAFERIFGRHLMNAALLVFLAVALAGAMSDGSELVRDSDLWWHLADARLLFTTHHFIYAEPYSFTVHGAPWINPEWLAEVPYWIGYLLAGLAGVHLVAIIAFAANLLLVYFRSSSAARHKGAAFWTAVLCFPLIAINGGARTIVIAYLALSVEMIILNAAEQGRTRMLWLLPPLFCVWINLHGSWFIGLGLLTLYIVCGSFSIDMGVFKQAAFSAAERNRLILIFLSTVAACFVNPYGWRLVWNPLDMLLNQKLMLAVMEEWQPLNLGTVTGKAAVLFIGLMIVANCIRARRWKIYEFVFTLVAWYVAFSHVRFVFLACIVTAPWLARDMARSFFGEPNEKTIPALNALFAAGAAVAIVYLFPSQAALEKKVATAFPMQTIASIQPSWRTFNDYSVAGMMDFDSKPTFMDSRNDVFEHHGIFQDFLAISNLGDPLRLLDSYRIDHVLIHANTPLSYLLERTKGWRIKTSEGTGENAFNLFERSSQ